MLYSIIWNTVNDINGANACFIDGFEEAVIATLREPARSIVSRAIERDRDTEALNPLLALILERAKNTRHELSIDDGARSFSLAASRINEAALDVEALVAEGQANAVTMLLVD